MAALEVRAVLFDLDGTLYDMAAMRRRVVFRLLRLLVAAGPLAGLRQLDWLRRYRRAREAHRGREPVPDLCGALVAEVARQTGAEAARIRAVVRAWFYESSFPELRGAAWPEARRVVETLAWRGYKVALLSEYPVERKLAALGLADLPWAATVHCDEVGVLKPDPRPFAVAAARLDVVPAEVLMVGDRRDADVAGARAAGMRSAWLDTPAEGHRPGLAPDHVLGDLADLLPLLPGRGRRDGP